VGVLPVLRHFLFALSHPERQSWQLAYKIAAERWGEVPGLSIANLLFKTIRFVVEARSGSFAVVDPLCLKDRDRVTRDEVAFLRMLHHMRRDDTAQARDAVADLTQGTMDPNVIRSGLSFAHRYSCGQSGAPVRPPQLRIVSAG